MPLNASPGDHLVMGNHRAQYTRSGWVPLEQGASLNLPLGLVRRGKVSRFLNRVQFETRSTNLPRSPRGGEDLNWNLRVSNWTRFSQNNGRACIRTLSGLPQ